MAIKILIALCLVLGALLVHAEPEADADAYYGHHRGYYHNRGYYGHRYYGGYHHRRHHHRPYGYYKPRYHGYWNRPTYNYHHYQPAPIAPSPAPVHAPIEVKAAPAAVSVPHPAPPVEVQTAPVAAPAPVAKVEPLHYEERVLNAFNVVPAVPEEHSVAYSALPMMAAPPPPAEVYEQDPLPEVHVAPAPVANSLDEVVASQYHAQDEFGNVIYGYSNPNSAKTEQRDVYGNVVGSYSYVDGTGLPKHVAYVADDFGFRVTSANNLPIAHVV